MYNSTERSTRSKNVLFDICLEHIPGQSHVFCMFWGRDRVHHLLSVKYFIMHTYFCNIYKALTVGETVYHVR